MVLSLKSWSQIESFNIKLHSIMFSSHEFVRKLLFVTGIDMNLNWNLQWVGDAVNRKIIILSNHLFRVYKFYDQFI